MNPTLHLVFVAFSLAVCGFIFGMLILTIRAHRQMRRKDAYLLQKLTEPSRFTVVNDPQDLMFLQVMRGAQFSSRATIRLPSGRVITGQQFEDPSINPYFDI